MDKTTAQVKPDATTTRHNRTKSMGDAKAPALAGMHDGTSGVRRKSSRFGSLRKGLENKLGLRTPSHKRNSGAPAAADADTIVDDKGPDGLLHVETGTPVDAVPSRPLSRASKYDDIPAGSTYAPEAEPTLSPADHPLPASKAGSHADLADAGSVWEEVDTESAQIRTDAAIAAALEEGERAPSMYAGEGADAADDHPSKSIEGSAKASAAASGRSTPKSKPVTPVKIVVEEAVDAPKNDSAPDANDGQAAAANQAAEEAPKATAAKAKSKYVVRPSMLAFSLGTMALGVGGIIVAALNIIPFLVLTAITFAAALAVTLISVAALIFSFVPQKAKAKSADKAVPEVVAANVNANANEAAPKVEAAFVPLSLAFEANPAPAPARIVTPANDIKSGRSSLKSVSPPVSNRSPSIKADPAGELDVRSNSGRMTATSV